MRTLLILMLSASLLPLSALGDHREIHPTGWFEYQYNEDDTAVLYCDALGEISIEGKLYIHDRNFVDLYYPLSGGGIWTFAESNDIPGLQIGGEPVIPDVPDPTGQYPYLVTFTDPYGPADPSNNHPGCPNGDTVLL